MLKSLIKRQLKLKKEKIRKELTFILIQRFQK